MPTPEFNYQDPFPLGKDESEYYLLTKDHVSVAQFEGETIVKIEPEGLTKLANAAFRDTSFMLRTAHLEQVASKIGNKTLAFIAVHLFGLPENIKALKSS